MLSKASNSSDQNSQNKVEEESIEDLIGKIQSTVDGVGSKMAQVLENYEFKELLEFKDDLFKTQEEFVQVRSQKNEEEIKTRVTKEKNEKETAFNKEIKQSSQVTKKYEELKLMMKEMQERELQLKHEISFMKKKVAKNRKEGLSLDEQLLSLQSHRPSQQNSTQRSSQHKAKHNSDLFKEVVNKCDKSVNGSKLQSQKPTVEDNAKQKIQHGNLLTEKRLNQKLENIKEYLSVIPLDLNFIESKIEEKMIERQSNVSQAQKGKKCRDINISEILCESSEQTSSHLPSLRQNNGSGKLLEEILKDQQVKQYLYDVLFGRSE